MFLINGFYYALTHKQRRRSLNHVRESSRASLLSQTEHLLSRGQHGLFLKEKGMRWTCEICLGNCVPKMATSSGSRRARWFAKPISVQRQNSLLPKGNATHRKCSERTQALSVSTQHLEDVVGLNRLDTTKFFHGAGLALKMRRLSQVCSISTPENLEPKFVVP